MPPCGVTGSRQHNPSCSSSSNRLSALALGLMCIALVGVEGQAKSVNSDKHIHVMSHDNCFVWL